MHIKSKFAHDTARTHLDVDVRHARLDLLLEHKQRILWTMRHGAATVHISMRALSGMFLPRSTEMVATPLLTTLTHVAR